ncbi:MAG: anti-sigma factor [Blastocatellales bacterium]
MTCRDFENIAGAVAAGSLMEAGMRERAMRHAAGCSACAARLNTERSLDAGLRALAESDENEQAPARLKIALRAAFDQQAKISAASVLPFPPVRGRGWARWSLAAAAALIIFAVAIALLSRNAEPNQNKLSVAGNPTPSPTPMTRDQKQQREISPDNQERKVEKHIADISKPPIKLRAPRRATASPTATDDVASEIETVTDYIPLTYLADATAVESGIVVRVELSRSALIAMGLPVNVDRTDSRVKADVVLGDDGVARAVRFVQ